MINEMIVALMITLLVESLMARLAGLRQRREALAIISINVITNPALNYFLWLNAYFHLVDMNLGLIYLLEAAVVLIEWRLLVFALGGDSKRMFALSLLMNFCSYAFGLLLFSSR